MKEKQNSLAKCLKSVRNSVAVIEGHEKQIDTIGKPIVEKVHSVYNKMFKILKQQEEKRVECIYDTISSFKKSFLAGKERAKHMESQVMSCLQYSSSTVNSRHTLLHNKWIIDKLDEVINQVQHDSPGYIDEPNEILAACASCPVVVSHLSLLTDTDFLHIPTTNPNCIVEAVQIGYSVKLIVILTDAYDLPVIDQSRHLKIHCNKENIIQNVEIDEQADGLYHIWYIPKRKEDHSISVHWRNNLISKETELSGEFIQDINIIDKCGPSNKLQMPYLIGKGLKDKVIITDNSSNQLIVYDHKLNFLHVIRLEFKSITGILFHKQCFFLSEQHLNVIIKLELNGNFISSFGSSGTSTGQFQSPHGLVFSHSEQLLFVCDRHNHRIQAFQDEKFAYCFGKHGTKPGAFNHPIDLTLNNSERQLFITDNYNHRVQVFTTQGQLLTVLGSSADVPVALQHPVGIYCTPDNYLLVSSYGTDSVLIFKEDGSFYSSIKDTKKFNSPCGVAMINRQIVIASHLKSRLVFC